MKIKTGKIKLALLFEECKQLIDNSIYKKKYTKSIIFDKLNLKFIESLLEKHFTFYVKKNILDDSKNIENNFAFYSKNIFETDDIFRLLFLKNLSDFDKDNYEINWIIIESTSNIKQLTINEELLFLDYFIKKDTANQKGLIDYELFEDIILSEHENIKKEYLHRSRKNFLSNIYNLKLNKKSYAPKKLEYYDNADQIKVKASYQKYLYVFYCPLCNLPYNIYLNGNDSANVNKYISFDEKNDRIIFECNHDGSNIYRKVNIGFRSDKLENGLDNNESYNKAFLYFFKTFQFKDDSTFYYVNTVNQLSEFEISKYIDTYKC